MEYPWYVKGMCSQCKHVKPLPDLQYECLAFSAKQGEPDIRDKNMECYDCSTYTPKQEVK